MGGKNGEMKSVKPKMISEEIFKHNIVEHRMCGQETPPGNHETENFKESKGEMNITQQEMLGINYFNNKQYKEAIDCYAKVLPVIQAQGDRDGERTVRKRLGDASYLLDRHADAITHYKKTLEIPVELPKYKNNDEMSLQKCLGDAYVQTNMHTEAINCYNKALKIAEKLNDKSNRVKLNCKLGDIHFKNENYVDAGRYYQEAGNIAKELDDKYLTSRLLARAGDAFFNHPEYGRAISLYQESKKVTQDTKQKSLILEMLGNCYINVEQFTKSIDCFRSALEIHEKRKDSGEVRRIRAKKRNVEFSADAIICLNESIKKLNDKSQEESHALVCLGNAYSDLGLYEKATKFYKDCLKISRSLGNRKEEGIAHGRLAAVYYCNEQYKKAVKSNQKALEIGRECMCQNLQREAFKLFGCLYKNFNNYEKPVQRLLVHFRNAERMKKEKESMERRKSGSSDEDQNTSSMCTPEDKSSSESGSIGSVKDKYNGAQPSRRGNGNCDDSENGCIGYQRFAGSGGTFGCGDCYSGNGSSETTVNCSGGIDSGAAIDDSSSGCFGGGNSDGKVIDKGDGSDGCSGGDGKDGGRGNRGSSIADGHSGGSGDSNVSGGSKASDSDGGRGGDGKDSGGSSRNSSVADGRNGGCSGDSNVSGGSGSDGSDSGSSNDGENSEGGSGGGSSGAGGGGSGDDNSGGNNDGSGDSGGDMNSSDDGDSSDENSSDTNESDGDSNEDRENYISQKELSKLECSSFCEALLKINLREIYDGYSNTVILSEWNEIHKNVMEALLSLNQKKSALIICDIGKVTALRMRYRSHPDTPHDNIINKKHIEWIKKVSNDPCLPNNDEFLHQIFKSINDSIEDGSKTVLAYAFDNNHALHTFVVSKKGMFHDKSCQEYEQLEKNLTKALQELEPSGPSTGKVDKPTDSNYDNQNNLSSTTSQSPTSATEVFMNPGGRSDNNAEGHDRIPIEHDENSGSIFTTLYSNLIFPVEEHLCGNKLVIVPQDMLYMLPFTALRSPKDKQLLVEQFSLQMTPALDLLNPEMPMPNCRHALFVGDPNGNLVHARNEVQECCKHFRSTPLLQEQAKKENVLKGMEKATIIHVAAHGEYSLNKVALRLNGSEELCPQDVIKMRPLEARLVVLSCCYSARDYRSRDEMPGVMGSFLVAGARSVLAAYSKIEDKSTLALIKTFYDNVRHHKSVCLALKQSIEQLLKENYDFTNLMQFGIWGEDIAFTEDDFHTIRSQATLSVNDQQTTTGLRDDDEDRCGEFHETQGENFFRYGDFDQAQAHYKEAIRFFKAKNNDGRVASLKIALAKVIMAIKSMKKLEEENKIYY